MQASQTVFDAIHDLVSMQGRALRGCSGITLDTVAVLLPKFLLGRRHGVGSLRWTEVSSIQYACLSETLVVGKVACDRPVKAIPQQNTHQDLQLSLTLLRPQPTAPVSN